MTRRRLRHDYKGASELAAVMGQFCQEAAGISLDEHRRELEAIRARFREAEGLPNVQAMILDKYRHKKRIIEYLGHARADCDGAK